MNGGNNNGGRCRTATTTNNNNNKRAGRREERPPDMHARNPSMRFMRACIIFIPFIVRKAERSMPPGAPPLYGIETGVWTTGYLVANTVTDHNARGVPTGIRIRRRRPPACWTIKRPRPPRTQYEVVEMKDQKLYITVDPSRMLFLHLEYFVVVVSGHYNEIPLFRTTIRARQRVVLSDGFIKYKQCVSAKWKIIKKRLNVFWHSPNEKRLKHSRRIFCRPIVS